MEPSPVGRNTAPAVSTRVFRAAAATAFCFATLSCLASPAFAQQALERNLPASVERTGNPLSIGAADYGKADDTPLGMSVRGIRLIGRTDAVAPAAGGISFGDVPDIDHASVSHALSPFLGKPMTRALIARMQAEIAAVWRSAGYPFVSVTLPPQEVTAGTLSLRVIEFRAGKIQTNPEASAHNQSLPRACG